MIGNLQSKPALRTPAQYASGHLIITDSLLCPWEKKALTFPLNSTRLIWTLSMAPLNVCINEV